MRWIVRRVVFTLALTLPAVAGAQKPAPTPVPPAVEVVRVGGYPEFRVEGTPFFIHSATFFYFRIPRDLWDSSLDRHRELGINTIDLLIPWNWHEPQEGKFDFEGRTNPRRDLRGLLQLLAEKGFKVIARPGPIIGADWWHAGYPGWLLSRPEFEMDPEALRTGGPPPLAELAATDADAAARGWMANAVHMEHARHWLSNVAGELAPYAAGRKITGRVRNEKGEFETKTIPGPVILVQVGDSLARREMAGPDWTRYSDTLREALAGQGLGGLFFVHAGERGDATSGNLPAMGDWFPPRPLRPAPEGTTFHLTSRDAAEIEYAVERLKGRTGLPPMLIGFQAGWRAPADDSRPPESHPANTLLAWRLALGHGAGGINYFPLQDSLTPAGYVTPGANRHYRWDAALDLAGNDHPRSRFVTRNAQILTQWGGQLAASHLRSDFGVVLADSPVDAIAAKQISRVLFLAGLSLERVDAERQSADELLRHALVLLPPRPTALSAVAQERLADYVRRGGTLVVIPPYPAGQVLQELWNARGPAAGAPRKWRAGQGTIIESVDFFSWVELDEDFDQTRMRGEEPAALAALKEILNRAAVLPVVRRAVDGTATGELAITQLVSNAQTGLLGERAGGSGFLVVTNLSPFETAEETVEVIPPRASLHAGEAPIQLPLQVPSHESLLLPLNIPLCAAAKPADRCRDEIIGASIELVDIQRDGRNLELIFYAPSRGTVLVRLARQPRRVQMEEFRIDGTWLPDENLLRLQVPRGAWPDFRRKVRISLPYTPFVPEPPKKKESGRTDFDYSVADSVRLPLGDDASLPTEPPLILLDQECTGQVLMQGTNYDELGRTIDFRVEGAARGSDSTTLIGYDTRQVVVKLKGTPETCANQQENGDQEGLLRGQVEAKSGRDRRQTLLYFVPIPEAGTTAYHIEFDRDGAKEWVLENKGLRLIVSPELGGRALAIVDKLSRYSFLTNIGGAIDERASSSYSAQWIKEGNETRLWVGDADNRVAKTMRLGDADTVIVDYQLELPAEERFTAVNSVIAHGGDRGTQFCWKGDGPDSESVCEAFSAGATINVPEGSRSLDIRGAGQPTLTLEWEAGSMRIEMKNFSTLLRLGFPAGTKKNLLRYRVKSEE